MTRILSLFLGLLSLCLLSSCVSQFEKEWRIALAAGPKPGVEGAWRGIWDSDASAHHGKLRCVVGPGNMQGEHEFHYHATWGALFRGSYRAIHAVNREKDGTYTFTGSHQMPEWAGGLYNYSGTIYKDDFKAGYHSQADHGKYTMRRIK